MPPSAIARPWPAPSASPRPSWSRPRSRIVSAADRSLALEQEVFAELAAAIAREERALGELAAALAELDCEAALAEVAVEQSYVRPHLDDSAAFDIRGGRHPVVEQALSAAKAGAFIENDCVLAAARPEVPDGFDELTEARLWLVTGPNMAGKSTFLRQNALITVLAQMGSFVPARSAHIGIVDRLFSRVGAADDLARGRSTFMVEMVETAAILNQAGDRSLVILDEIGRGTATFDGLSIAWAVVEYLHEVSKCRALFATHYHELTALAGRLAGVANVTMDVREWRDEIVFLHKVKPGAADRSYGIQVGQARGPAQAGDGTRAGGAGAAGKERQQGARRACARRAAAVCRPPPAVGPRRALRPVGDRSRAGRHQPRRTHPQSRAGALYLIQGFAPKKRRLMQQDPPDGFAPHFKKSPVTNPWEPLYSRRLGTTVQIGLWLREAHCNSRGLVHGGVIATLADNAMGLSCVGATPDAKSALTVSLSLDYLSTAKVGQWLQIEPRVVRTGRTLGFVDAIITAGGEPVARANATFRILS